MRKSHAYVGIQKGIPPYQKEGFSLHTICARLGGPPWEPPTLISKRGRAHTNARNIRTLFDRIGFAYLKREKQCDSMLAADLSQSKFLMANVISSVQDFTRVLIQND